MISIQLGRPFLFHDEDIDIQMPLNIDDHLSVEEVIARLQESADIADNNDANVDYASNVTTVSTPPFSRSSVFIIGIMYRCQPSSTALN